MIASMLLNETTLLWSWLLYGPLLLFAIWRAPWVELFSDSRRQHLLFGTVLVLCILWLLRRDFPSGLSFHFIGMTAVFATGLAAGHIGRFNCSTGITELR